MTMEPTPYPDINELLGSLLSQMQDILGDRLVGLYLYGSLVTGDFDREISDIDLLAATSGDIDEREFEALDRMQNGFVSVHRYWEGRLEIAYLSLHALKTFKTHASPIAVISPGEPFHIKEAGKDWIINWYIVREKGVTLAGPPPTAIIEPISIEEYIQSVKEHAGGWRERISDVRNRGSQAYTILTMCRALYTCRNGEPVSKIQAAVWAEQELPEWAALIQNAVGWRQAQWREENVDHEATLPETRRFVDFVIDLIV